MKGKITVTVTLNDPELIASNPGNEIQSHDVDGFVLIGMLPDGDERGNLFAECVGKVNPDAIAHGMLSLPFAKSVVSRMVLHEVLGGILDNTNEQPNENEPDEDEHACAASPDPKFGGKIVSIDGKQPE